MFTTRECFQSLTFMRNQMMNHNETVMGPSLEAQPKVYVASQNEAWLTNVEKASTAEGCKCITGSSTTALVSRVQSGEDIACLMIDYDPTTQEWSSIEQLLVDRNLVAPVVLVISDSDSLQATEAVARVAHVVAIHSMEEHEIVEVIRDARALTPLVNHQFDVLRCHQLYENLPERQRRIVDLVVDGAPNKQIATKLEVSVKTIERDRQKAYQSLNVRSTAEMTRVVILGSLHEVVFPPRKPRPQLQRARGTAPATSTLSQASMSSGSLPSGSVSSPMITPL